MYSLIIYINKNNPESREGGNSVTGGENLRAVLPSIFGPDPVNLGYYCETISLIQTGYVTFRGIRSQMILKGFSEGFSPHLPLRNPILVLVPKIYTAQLNQITWELLRRLLSFTPKQQQNKIKTVQIQ